MSTHLTDEQLRRLGSREATLDEIEAARSHAATCDTCAEQLVDEAVPDTAHLGAVLRQDRDVTDHPTELQLRALARGTLDAADREVVESHVEDCDTCRAATATPRRRPRWTWIAIAAALAMAIGLGVFQRPATREETSIDPPPPALTTSAAPTPEPPAPRYANPEWQALADETRRTGRLPLAELASRVRVGPDVVRGPSDAAQGELAPTGVVVESPTPTFTWPATAGATYVVSIFEGDDEIARSPRLSKTTWTSARALPRARPLGWQVEVFTAEGSHVIPALPAPQALFAIAAEPAVRELALARESHPEDHVLLAALYARAGMRREAERELALSRK
jgi:anti-sigma factor RsiW